MAKEKKETAFLGAYIPVPLMDWFRRIAKQQNRSVSQQLIHVLKALKDDKSV